MYKRQDESRPLGSADSAERKPVILLADDNADMREYVSGLLGGRFQLVQTRTGKAALAETERGIPDLVLTDVMMPEMDGFAFVAALRKNPLTRTAVSYTHLDVYKRQGRDSWRIIAYANIPLRKV